MSRSLLSAFGSAMGSRLGTAALNYGLFWALSRLVDTPTLGGFSLLMNIFLLVQLLPLLGLTVPLMRRVATSSTDLREELSNAFAFALPVALVLTLLVGGWGQAFHRETLSLAFWLVALSLLPTAWTIVAEAALLGQERVADVARINFVEALLRTVLAAAAVWLGHGLVGVFLVFLALRFLAALIYASHPLLPLPTLAAWKWQLQRRNWTEVPVFLSIAIVAALVSRLDLITLSHLRGLHDTAVYAAASRLYDAAQMLPTVMALVVLPTLARQFASAREQFRVSLGLSVRLGLLFGLGLALLASALARPLIDLLYLPDMAGATQVLRWLIFAAVIMSVDVLLSSTMLAANAQQHDLRSLAFGLFALALALCILVPRLGPTGAAIAVVLGLGTRMLTRLHWAVREFDMPSPWLHLARLAAACLVGLGVMSITPRQLGVPAAAAASLGSYALALIAFGALGRHPLRGLRADIALLLQRGQH